MRNIFLQMESPWFTWFMTAMSFSMLYLYVGTYDSNVLEFWAWAVMFLVWSSSAIYKTWFRHNSHQ